MVLHLNKIKVYGQISILKGTKAVNIIIFCAIHFTALNSITVNYICN